VGNVLEPPLGVLGDAWDRRSLVRGGGVVFALALAVVAVSGGFLPLLLALVLLSPASGAFVGLSQAALMDLEPARHEVNMARWVLAGSLGVVAGPLVFTTAGAGGVGWRGVFLLYGLLAVLVLRLAWARVPSHRGVAEGPLGTAFGTAARDLVGALRRRDVTRWLVLLQLADLMLDVFHGFLGLYFVDVVGAGLAGSALAILIWTLVGLAGDALLVPLLERFDGARWVRASAVGVLVVFPAFLLVEDRVAKLALLGLIGLLNSGWYSVLQGRLYSSLPGRSSLVMAMGSLAGILGALLPLGVGLAAERFGLEVAIWLLLAGPLALALWVPTRAGGLPS